MGCEAHGRTEGTGDWEPVIASISCNYYAISDPDGPAWQKSSNPEDVNACRSFPAGSSFAITAPHFSETGWRWNKGDVITWVKSSSPLSLYFLR